MVIKKGSKTKWWGPKKPLINRQREKERLMRVRLQELIFPACLPQDGLIAVYLGKVAPSSAGIVTDESGVSGDAQLVDSPCLIFSGVGSIQVLDLTGSETIFSSGGTSTPSVVAGQINFTAGTCWDLKLSSGHNFWLSESGVTNTCINSGSGVNGELINVVTPNAREGKTDSFHPNNLNDIDIYSNGVAGEEIRIPAEKPFSQAGYTFVSTNPAGAWDNDGGAKLQLPDTLASLQATALFSSLTDNKNLDWENGEIINYSKKEFGNGTVMQKGVGTEFYCPSGADTAGIEINNFIEAGVIYHFAVFVEEIIEGNLYLQMGDVAGILDAEGWITGSLTSSIDGVFRVQDNANPTTVTVSKVLIWKDGEIPPLSYREMQSSYNNIAFQNTEEDKKKKLVVYGAEVTNIEDLLKIQKCIKMEQGIDVLLEDDGVTPQADDDDIYLLED